jgi:hypothetical protein
MFSETLNGTEMWGAATVTNIYVLRWHLQQATADVSQLFAENYQKLR